MSDQEENYLVKILVQCPTSVWCAWLLPGYLLTPINHLQEDTPEIQNIQFLCIPTVKNDAENEGNFLLGCTSPMLGVPSSPTVQRCKRLTCSNQLANNITDLDINNVPKAGQSPKRADISFAAVEQSDGKIQNVSQTENLTMQANWKDIIPNGVPSSPKLHWHRRDPVLQRGQSSPRFNKAPNNATDANKSIFFIDLRLPNLKKADARAAVVHQSGDKT